MPGGFEKKELRLEIWDSILATAGGLFWKKILEKKKLKNSGDEILSLVLKSFIASSGASQEKVFTKNIVLMEYFLKDCWIFLIKIVSKINEILQNSCFIV